MALEDSDNRWRLEGVSSWILNSAIVSVVPEMEVQG